LRLKLNYSQLLVDESCHLLLQLAFWKN
jgi:hypothetical protein